MGENNSTSAPEPKLNADASTMISHPDNDINDQMDSDSSKQESGGNVLGENNNENSEHMATDEAEQNEELGIAKKNKIISSITIVKLNADLQNKNTEHILNADTSPLNSHAENDESLSINEQMDSDTPEQDASDKNGRKPITCAKVLTENNSKYSVQELKDIIANTSLIGTDEDLSSDSEDPDIPSYEDPDCQLNQYLNIFNTQRSLESTQDESSAKRMKIFEHFMLFIRTEYAPLKNNRAEKLEQMIFDKKIVRFADFGGLTSTRYAEYKTFLLDKFCHRKAIVSIVVLNFKNVC